ncbi:hypothetical protein ACQKGO_21020 [Corallococcus interemptor]
MTPRSATPGGGARAPGFIGTEAIVALQLVLGRVFATVVVPRRLFVGRD